MVARIIMKFDDGTDLNMDSIREILFAVLVLLSLSILIAISIYI